MIEPHVYLAYAPRGPGVMCALLYFEVKRSVYGWYVGSSQGEFPAQFFVLEDYYSAQKTRLYLSVESDVYSDWIQREVAVDVPIGSPAPVPEELTHELERMQDAFIHEWLFYADDPKSAAQANMYASRELSVQPVNIRANRINKLDAGAAVWTYASPGCNLNMVRTLSKRWSLDYALD
jgi:hypothetical protein